MALRHPYLSSFPGGEPLPRKSAAALAVPRPVDGRPPRLTAPAWMSLAEKEVFDEVAAAVDARHLVRADLSMFCTFVSGVVLSRQAAAELRAASPVTPQGTVSPWLRVWETAAKTVGALGHKLRLAPSAREHPRTTARRVQTGIAPLAWLEQQRHGEPRR